MGLFNFYFSNTNFNEKALTKINNKLLILTLNQKIIMATLAEISAKADQLQASLDAEQQQILDAIAALEQIVLDLQGQLADGGTESERQAVLDKLDATIADLEATIPDEPEV
jgi:cell division septum initiation protein DivIVA